MLDLAYTSRAKELCARIQEERNIIHTTLWQLLDAFLPIYTKTFTALQGDALEILKKEAERRSSIS